MNGYNVIYLGQNLPHSLLLSLKDKNKIDNILFSIVANTSKLNAAEIIHFLETHFSESKIHAIVNKNLITEEGFQKLSTITSIDEFINLITN
jgi:methanogenic corrinoid protein MtbC1